MGSSFDFGSRTLVIVAMVLAVAIGYRVVRPHSTFEAGGTDASWDSAVNQSQSRNMPGVVLYTAGWCPACRALHGEALADPAVWRELANRHTFVTVDLTEPTAAAHAHATAAGVSAIPTLIRYDRDGHETGRTHGLPADQLLAWLQE